MKVIAKFSVDETKCILELLSCTSKPFGWTVPQKRQQYVFIYLQLWTPQSKKTKQESKGVACNLFYARAEHLKELKLETHFKNDTPMNYNFHCYNFNHLYIFINIITLKNIDIVSKNDILGKD